MYERDGWCLLCLSPYYQCFNRGIFSRSKKWGNGIITNLFQNPFKPFNFDVRKSPQPSLGFVQSLEAVVGNTEILVLRERKTKNWKKWHLELSWHNKTSHRVSLGQKSEIMFWWLLRISSSLILSTEPNARGTSVKIGFSPDYLDFENFELFLTAHHSSK